MYKVLFPLFFFAVASVFAAPFVFDKKFLGGHKDFSVVHHVTYLEGSHYNGTYVRFLHAVPKVGFDLHEGFSTPRFNNAVFVPHSNLAEDEKLLEFLGFSDCKTWYAWAYVAYFPSVGVVHRVHTFVREAKDGVFVHKFYDTLAGLAAFVYLHLTKAHFDGLVLNGLPSHQVTHLLKHQFHPVYAAN